MFISSTSYKNSTKYFFKHGCTQISNGLISPGTSAIKNFSVFYWALEINSYFGTSNDKFQIVKHKNKKFEISLNGAVIHCLLRLNIPVYSQFNFKRKILFGKQVELPSGGVPKLHLLIHIIHFRSGCLSSVDLDLFV